MHTTRKLLVAAAALLAATTAVVGTAAALDDPVLNAAIAANAIGEQADGYLGAVAGASPSQDARSRMNQVNLQRREAYTARAQANAVTVDEYARTTACMLLTKNTPSGASYRDQNNAWQRNTSGVTLPSYCPRG